MLAGKNQPNYENLCCQLINDKSVLKIYDMYVCMIWLWYVAALDTVAYPQENYLIF